VNEIILFHNIEKSLRVLIRLPVSVTDHDFLTSFRSVSNHLLNLQRTFSRVFRIVPSDTWMAIGNWFITNLGLNVSDLFCLRVRNDHLRTS
jgi:hypothetical protein